MEEDRFHDTLKERMDEFVHLIYKITKNFPKEELYGANSQLRIASLSVVLNYVEGYARKRTKTLKYFLEISYGSLQEAKYLIHFSYKEAWVLNDEFKKAHNLANEIGAMIWGILRKL